MKRVIHFSRARWYFYGFSSLLILAGVVGFIVNHGFNLGVDFQAGISFQFQVAPASFTVQYAGPDRAQISIPAGEQALTAPGDIIFTITNSKNGTKTSYPFSYKSFGTVKDLAAAIQSQVPGVTANVVGDSTAKPTDLLPLPRPADITDSVETINLAPASNRGVVASIADVRTLLDELGEFTLQAVGPADNQEFLTRIPVKAGTDESTFQQDMQNRLMNVLETKYGQGQVILKSTDFVGARMAQSLVGQTVWLVIIALALILAYMFIRFRPWFFGVAAVLGIMHDGIVMLAFDAIFRVEIDAGTIAAILTILGYSINDTIVNFDRARENKGLMRGDRMQDILDTSVTQTLSRTFITSGATLLTVIALFVLTSGTIKNFALNMIVGIVEGTYSTFISAFFVISWLNMRDRKHKQEVADKFGAAQPAFAGAAAATGGAVAGQPQGQLEAGADVEAEGEAEGDIAEEPSEPGAPIGLAPEAAGAAGSAAAAAMAQPAPAGGPQNVGPFMGHSGSRKNKKHRRRHH